MGRPKVVYLDPQLDEDTLLGHVNRAGGLAELAAKWGTTPEQLAEVIKAMRRCTTTCDADCDVACHETHQPAWRRHHQPEDCPGRRWT